MRDTPRNKVARDGNAFREQFARWADAINKCRDGKYDASEAAAWDALPELWRKLERARRDWRIREVG
jgi:hypothetical protein